MRVSILLSFFALGVLLAGCTTAPQTTPTADVTEPTNPIRVPETTPTPAETTPTPAPATPIPAPESMTPTTSEPGSTGVTAAELATHNTREDCWVGYKGTAYDITAWLPRHPGGVNAIARYCGTTDEFTAAFNKRHKTSQEGRLAKEGTNMGALA